MASLKINVKPQKLESVATQIQNIAGEIRSNAGRMDEVNNTVEAAWKSRYTSQYMQDVDKVKRNLTKLAQQTENLAKIMRDTAKKVRDIEEANARSFSGGGSGSGSGGGGGGMGSR